MSRLRYVRLALLCAAIMTLPACYDYVPVTTSPPVGEIIAIEITDRGRGDLADRFGSGILRIEGRLMSAPADQYVLAVSRITQINGDKASWNGETVRLNRAVVGGIENRRFSRGRTAIVAAVATAGVVGFIASRYAASSSSGSTDTTAGKSPASSRIPIVRFVF
jgi:hypothetical protein